MQLQKKSLPHSLSYFLITLIIPLLCMSGPATTRAVEKQAERGCAIAGPTGNIKHVIQIMFDNVHMSRDNPSVPSDLEQMPHLLNFLKDNGTVFANHHTTLIAHTGTGLLTSMTGVYGDRHGVPVSNSFRYFNTQHVAESARIFAYWNAHVNHQPDLPYNMLDEHGKNAPAPWVPFTRAGCNVGTVAAANTTLQDPATEIPTIFGNGSPEEKELRANADLAKTDFTQIAVHCTSGAALCSTANHGRPDILPTEPGGYSGFSALYGHKYVAPQISLSGPLQDLNGNVIQDHLGHPGFPGSVDSMVPAVSLSYVAAMQEHGIPVTYAYIPDARDKRTVPGKPSYKPGELGYVEGLKQYDDAFGKFFARLKQDGITKDNTLFAFWADEGDHFVAHPLPDNCNGKTVPCTGYSHMGEVTLNLPGLLAIQKGIKTPFTQTDDSSPTLFLTGNPARGDSTTRAFGRALAGITSMNPLLAGQNEKIANYLADPVEMKLLHMVTADPSRTPTLTLFAKPDYFVKSGPQDCNSPCVTQAADYAWNRGTVSPDINVTWLGLVGPGVRNLGETQQIWSDQTDARPTLLLLLGLRDDYRHDGRVLFEALDSRILPSKIQMYHALYTHLAQTYKQIYATLGSLGQESLRISTEAIASNTGGDATYKSLELQLQKINQQRDTIAAKMILLLEQAEFGQSQDSASETQTQSLITQGEALLSRIQTLR